MPTTTVVVRVRILQNMDSAAFFSRRRKRESVGSGKSMRVEEPEGLADASARK